MSIEKKKPLFLDPLEVSTGLSIDQSIGTNQNTKVADIKMTADKMKDGVYLGLGLNGLRYIM